MFSYVCVCLDVFRYVVHYVVRYLFRYVFISFVSSLFRHFVVVCSLRPYVFRVLCISYVCYLVMHVCVSLVPVSSVGRYFFISIVRSSVFVSLVRVLCLCVCVCSSCM